MKKILSLDNALFFLAGILCCFAFMYLNTNHLVSGMKTQSDTVTQFHKELKEKEAKLKIREKEVVSILLSALRSKDDADQTPPPSDYSYGPDYYTGTTQAPMYVGFRDVISGDLTFRAYKKPFDIQSDWIFFPPPRFFGCPWAPIEFSGYGIETYRAY